jgi:DNA-binding beta-propeller fold protein YncE
MNVLRCFIRLSLMLSLLLASKAAPAAIVATGFFSGTIERFDPVTGAQSTLATIASGTDPFPGLAGITYHAPTNTLYAAARVSNRVYRVNASSGAILGFTQLATGSSPASVVVDNLGNLYVANNGGNTVSVINPAGVQTGTITLPNIGLGDNLPSGLAFDAQGGLIISTFAGGGLFRYDPGSGAVSPFAAGPTANGQIAIDAAGNVYVGGAAFSNDVLRFASDGTSGTALITIDANLLPLPPLPFASPNFTSPSGVAVDADGNLIVAALGRTNPTSAADNFQSNGGLWKFAPDGTLLQTFGVAGSLTGFSSVAVVPEPASLGILAAGCIVLLGRRYRKQ